MSSLCGAAGREDLGVRKDSRSCPHPVLPATPFKEQRHSMTSEGKGAVQTGCGAAALVLGSEARQGPHDPDLRLDRAPPKKKKNRKEAADIGVSSGPICSVPSFPGQHPLAHWRRVQDKFGLGNKTQKHDIKRFYYVCCLLKVEYLSPLKSFPSPPPPIWL